MKTVLSLTISLFLMVTVSAQADSVHKRNVAIFIFDEVELLDFAGPAEVFQLAEYKDHKAFNVYTVALTSDNILTQKFMSVKPNYSIDNCPTPDILVLPGGDTRTVNTNPKLLDWVKSVNAKTEYTMSVCTGASFLAKTGILDGLFATTHKLAIKKFIANYPKISFLEGKRYVDNGRILTTEGVSAGIDGSLYLVQKLLSKAAADDVADYMMYPWAPEKLNVYLKK